jgi:hypothetical protein
MIALMRCENGFSSVRRVVWRAVSGQIEERESGGEIDETYLSTAENLVAGQVEHVLHELRHRVAADP